MKTLYATMILMLLSSVAQAEGPCGPSVTVQRGDTLSSIAERCDVNESAILSANPAISGSEDLRIGETISLADRSAADRALQDLGSATREGAHALGSLAHQLKSSASDLLDKNPDLRNRWNAFKRQVAGPSKAVPDAAVTTTLGASNGTLHVVATNLPAQVKVFVGVGTPRAAYDVVETSETTAAGRLDATITLPDWARQAPRLVAVIGASDKDWLVRSKPLTVARP